MILDLLKSDWLWIPRIFSLPSCKKAKCEPMKFPYCKLKTEVGILNYWFKNCILQPNRPPVLVNIANLDCSNASTVVSNASSPVSSPCTPLPVTTTFHMGNEMVWIFTIRTIHHGLRLVPSGNFFLAQIRPALNKSHHFLLKNVRI